jgi:hypothetical protein
MQDGDCAPPLGREVLILPRVALVAGLRLVFHEQEALRTRLALDGVYGTDTKARRQNNKH